ncbi:ketopantoate reductase family protein [Streptosporangium lutulentum]|uniref:2-dehydropantoate 2-reductase n=1 Tax=Streptosporangium lutulentum TaxID=1461250 RepID=A0ABT9Q8E0_9ACTN|nr:2-dehydropantoate 2-reductase N-terminal domain-containing protein [Streptosporangium lutulentum]MDP9843017.1 2-dehydropantoate 2-reductase [Streptosporangium lutulentum]
MTGPRIAVLGTGANGAAIGADLTRAGLDVTFIEQWPEHVAAMRAAGVRVDMPEESVVTPVRALNLCEVATLREPFDLVFTLVKAYDTRWACELIKPLVKPDGLVIGLQNGMTIDAIADIMGPERTLGAVIECSAAMFEPGVVERHTPPAKSWFGLGSVTAATRPREREVADILGHAGTVEIVEDIRSAKWAKLLVNAGELVPSAVLNLPMREAMATPGMREFMLRCGIEAAEAIIATGNKLVPIFGLDGLDPTDPHKFVEALLDAVMYDFALPHTKTTVLHDWMKGRRCEVEEINGLVVDVHAEHGSSAPANAIAVELARRVESGELEARPENVDLMVKSLS